MAKLQIALSGKGNHLVFRGINFVDGIQDGEAKIGILAIEDASKGQATLAKAKKLKWELSEDKDDNGFYEVIRIGKAKADEDEDED